MCVCGRAGVCLVRPPPPPPPPSRSIKNRAVGGGQRRGDSQPAEAWQTQPNGDGMMQVEVLPLAVVSTCAYIG